MRATTAIFLSILLTAATALGQTNLQPVPGFPTQQVYDLLVDKKGFLWIGHELGISRYDGLSFTHFSHPNLSGLGMTDLIEDKQGRIWCHNFNSQIFYIENERMHWLKAYEFAKEVQYPRMALYNDELIITSTQGLFVCNTTNLKTKYIHTLGEKRIETTTLSHLTNGILAFNVGVANGPVEWYLYTAGKGLKKLKSDNAALSKDVALQHWALRPHTNKDTVYVSGNPFGILIKLMVRGDSVVRVGTLQTNDFINTITKDGDELWINTREKSISSRGATIHDLSVSDVVTDQQGNKWVGSINKGLLMDKDQSRIEMLSLEGLDKDDFVRAIAMGKNTIAMGTQNGKLLLLDKNSKKIIFQHIIPFKTSAIDVVRHLKGDLFIFSTSYTPFTIDAETKKIEELDLKAVVKDMDINKGSLFISTVSGLLLHPSPVNNLDVWYKPHEELLKAINVRKDGSHMLFVKPGRTDAVCFDDRANAILASFKDGVYEMSMNGVHPLLHQKERVYASALKYARNKLLIATFSNGLLIRDAKGSRRVGINEGLSSNNIIDMKVIGNHLWLFQTNAIQVMDVDNETIITEIDLPVLIGSTMVDVTELNDTAFLTSTEGVYKVPLKSSANSHPIRSYLTYALANNKDTLLRTDAVLPYHKNDIQIHLSAPWYNSNQPIFFKYRLVGGGDEQWHISKEPIVRFPSLMPGYYTFEAYAMHPSGKRAVNTISFEFEIVKPWWERWWLRSLVLLAVAGLFYALYRYRVNQLVKVENIRRSISSDLHDDIGATLSSINIYTELAKRQEDNREFLNLIQDNTREIIGKLDDLVWSINPKNDSAEQLINRMRSFSEPLLAGANINYKITCSDDLHKLKLNTGIKRNLYLIFKETVNNVAKHSQSKNCTIDIYYQNKRLYINIVDDGVGFDESHTKKNRNGLKNIQDRAKQIKAQIKIDSVKDQGTTVHLEASV